MTKPVVLPAKVYDELEALAERFGGIGRDRYTEPDRTPCCIVGFLGYRNEHLSVDGDRYTALSLDKALLANVEGRYEDDLAVEVYNDEIVGAWQLTHPGSRMPWAEYVRAFPLERGP